MKDTLPGDQLVVQYLEMDTSNGMTVQRKVLGGELLTMLIDGTTTP